MIDCSESQATAATPVSCRRVGLLKHLAPLLAGLVGAMAASSASAAEFFLTYSTEGDPGGPESVSAVLTTTDTMSTVEGRQAYTILGVSGVRGTGAILGQLPLGPAFHLLSMDSYLFIDGGKFFNKQGFAFADDVFHSISFEVVTGFNDFFPDAYFELERGNTFPYVFQASRRITLDVQPGRLTSGAVPEPATWALLLVGFGLAGSALRRRARAQAPQTLTGRLRA